MKEIILPTIHLNGTSPQALQIQYEQSALAITNAIKILEESGPHGRDYYPQGQSAFIAARAEHVSRLEVLYGVRNELKQLLDHVTKQNEG